MTISNRGLLLESKVCKLLDLSLRSASFFCLSVTSGKMCSEYWLTAVAKLIGNEKMGFRITVHVDITSF